MGHIMRRRSCGFVSGIILAAVTVSGCTNSDRPDCLPAPLPDEGPSRLRPTGPSPAELVLIPKGGALGEESEWRRDVSNEPVAPGSRAQVARLAETLDGLYNGNAAFNVYQYGVAWYTVGHSQPVVNVQYWNCQGKAQTPTGLAGPGGQFTAVPIPDDAMATPGTDASLSIYQPSTDTLWDFWKAYRDRTGWHACWGGRIDDISKSDGAFPGYFGASASGLAREMGVVSINDARLGSSPHALALSLPPQMLAAGWVPPAKRGDGVSNAPEAIPAGSRLRVNPRLDLSRLGLSPIAELVARAGQRYGFIVTDRAATVAVSAENPAAYVSRGGTDPWPRLMGGLAPAEIFEGFPWAELQVVSAAR